MLHALKQALASWSPGASPAVTWLLPELRTLLRAEFAGSYRPATTENGWSLDFMYGSGENADGFSQNFRHYVQRLPRSEQFLGHGNPHLVPVAQRNRVLPLEALDRLKVSELYEPLFRALGILGHDQLRVLLCDGPQQLSWIGATRAEPFTRREISLLGRLTRPLQRRFRLERQLAPGTSAAMLDAALEALGRAAFVVAPDGAIELANSAGRALLERDRKGVLESIAESERREPDHGSDEGPFSLTRVGVPGWPAYKLAIRNQPPQIVERVMLAQRRWGLSLRQARVLELIANGASNKEIARTLVCAEVTVENHITQLFRRSGATSRAGLVGRLITVAADT